MNGPIRIIEPRSPEDMEELQTLFLEYAESLGFDLDFQDFEAELASLPGVYAPPTGCMLLAKHGDRVAGCVCLRKLDDRVCEMKRLYVRMPFRHKGAGRLLAEHILEKGRSLGYLAMRLDTVPSMKSARALYDSLRFREIAPYCTNPIPGTAFLECRLDTKAGMTKTNVA